jgi:hypothetical protein
MPNRIIKQSLCESETIAKLSDFEFRLWISLIVLVDDAGRGDARPAIIKGKAFPLRSRVTEKDIVDALHGLAAKGCVSLYESDGKPYFWFPTWGQHQRLDRAKPKYPEPPMIDNPPQVAADCGLNTNTNTKYIKRKESIERKEKAPEVSEDMLGGFSGELREAVDDWLKYKAERRQAYKETGLKSVLTQISKNAKLYGDAAVTDVIRQSMANNYQGITFDKLKNKPKVSQSISQSVTKAQPQRTVTDADLVEYPYGSGKWMPYWEADELREAGK